MNVADDNKRAAIAFSVSLSGQLIAASMATLAVEGAYVWYALGARVTLPGFELFAVLTAASIAISVFAAGKGITAARDAGFADSWDLEAGKAQFNIQTVALLLALTFLAITFTRSGPSKQSMTDQRIDSINQTILQLQQDLQKQIAVSNDNTKRLSSRLQQLSDDVSNMRAQRNRRLKNQR
jgi:hypothetical protein